MLEINLKQIIMGLPKFDVTKLYATTSLNKNQHLKSLGPESGNIHYNTANQVYMSGFTNDKYDNSISGWYWKKDLYEIKAKDLTAKTFISKYQPDVWEAATRKQGYSLEEVETMLKDFAQAHVEAALEAAYDSARLEKAQTKDSATITRCYIIDDMGDGYNISKESILNAYPKSKIV